MRTFIILLFSVSVAYAQQPTIGWQKCVGGTAGEYAWSIKELSDGSFISCGYTDSNNGDFSGNHGNDDAVLIKMSSTGTVLWTKLYGGTEDDEAIDVISTSDGGFMMIGKTYSNDGDVSGNHGDNDIWLIKTDASGNIEWQHCYGGTWSDQGETIIQSAEGGYIFAGTVYSNNGDISGHHNTDYWDMWIVKITSSGAIEWQKCYGGANTEEAYSVAQASNGDYVIAGYTSSIDGDVSGNHGGSDSWIFRINSTGTILWQKCHGGANTEEFNSIVINSDQTIMALGYSNSSSGDLVGTGFHGSDDFCVAKFSSSGAVLWTKCYGGPYADQANRMAKSADGGYFLCGLASANGGDISGLHTSMLGPDIWVVKINSSGTLVWQKCLGGSDQDEGLYITATSDNNCIVTGFTYSTNGDVIGNHGNKDMWIIKLNGTSSNINEIEDSKFSLYPNPGNNLIHFSSIVETISISDISGKLIVDQVKISDNKFDINMLEPGVYFIQADKNAVIKFLKK